MRVAPVWATVEVENTIVWPFVYPPPGSEIVPLTSVAPAIATVFAVSVTVTGCVPVPFQPATIVPGAICSLNVKVSVSPFSGLPAVPPLVFAAWMSVAVGAVLSTTRFDTVEEYVKLFALSVVTARRS